MAEHKVKVAIIGSGPAGLTAAIYAARANLEPLVVEGIQPGGQLTITTDVENYPGFPEGIMGPDMMVAFRQQAERFGTKFLVGNVHTVELGGPPHKLITDDDTVVADSLIIASGAQAKLLGIESESKLMGYGVSACATCDGFFFKDQEVIVVGGGDTAMEEATFLTKFCKKVTIVHRREEFRASKIMLERAQKDPKIAWELNAQVKDIHGKPGPGGGVTSVTLESTKDGSSKEFSCTGVFIAIGHKPNTDLFVDKLDMDENGYLRITPGGTKTKVPGVFAAGDVADHVYRQAVTAAGTGCMASIDAERYLAHS